MTKIKNTKKGMAKKTLSISLAVAMLATSNVPVWAAEFTDGAEAVFTSEVEAPVAEEVVEAPVVEDVEEVADAQAEGSEYSVSWKTDDKAFETAPEWGKHYDYKVKVADGEKTVKEGLTWRWIDENGNASVNWTGSTLATPDAEGYFTIGADFPKDSVEKTFMLQVYEGTADNMTWNTKSSAITVAKKTVTGTVDFATNDPEVSEVVYYTGSQITTAPEFDVDDVNFGEDTVDDNEMKFDDFHAISGDTINSVQYHDGDANAKVVGETFIDSKYYTGKVNVSFYIWAKNVENINDIVTVTPLKSTYMYTGANITVPAKDITVKEKLGGIIENASGEATLEGNVGTDKTGTVAVSEVGSLKNYQINYNRNWTSADASFKYTVVKRDLADTVNTKMSVKPVVYSNTVKVGTVTKEDVLKNLTLKDADGTALTSITPYVGVVFENNKAELDVVQGGTYKATIKATGDFDNIINERTVEFTVVGNDLSAASFEKEDSIKDTSYAGTQITYGLTKDNLKEKLGDLKITENGTTRTLIPNDGSAAPEYDLNVTFGENTNVGTATIIIKGLGTYAGTEKVIEFEIIPAKASVLTVPGKTLFNASNREASDYNLDVVVSTAEFTDANGNKQTLTVPASDYVVTSTFVDGNVDRVAENAVLDKINTNVKASTDASGNFEITAADKTTTIVNKAITEADVQLEKTEYTYNASRIIPDYKVVVDGVTLVKDKDYTENVTHNDKVGEATLTITGKGDYDVTTSVSKKFTIVAADISNVKVAVKKEETIVYDGTQHVGPETTGKLVFTIDGNEVDPKEFTVLYPVSKLANINAGNGNVTLKPAKNNVNFVGEADFTFTISPKELDLNNAELKAYDKNGTAIDFSKALAYDGTAHKFNSVEFKHTETAPMKFTADDYEIIYKDNVIGKKAEGAETGKAAILVVAKGNYAGKEANDYVCADETVVKNVIAIAEFNITARDIKYANAVIENGAYAEGKNVEPVVKVTYKGKELVKDVDYKLNFNDVNCGSRTEVTNGKTLAVRIDGIGGYYGWVWNGKANDESGKFAWGIDKFDFENAEVIVSGTNEAPVIKVLNNGIVVDAKEYTVDTTTEEGKAILTAAADSKHYTGSKKVDIKVALEKPATPMLEKVTVNGNKATAVLSGNCEGAMGYDYVISTDKDCITNKDYDKVNKNILKTTTDFTYVQQGTYYAYCHAWTRDENGQKVFSDWSNAYPFVVGAITPSTPVITSVKASGSTVTVKYTAAENAAGYDVVLGSAVKVVAGEKRPVEYGTLVKKNIKDGVVTATFKNVPKGTYYAGLHAFNRTNPENNTKVFSPWSNTKKVTVK